MQVTGNIVKIKSTETIPSKTGGKDFVKREFWLQLPDERYPQTVSFELTGDKIDIIDAYQEGQDITVEFNLRGRIWNDKCFNTLQAWRILADGSGSASSEYSGGSQNSVRSNEPAPVPAFIGTDSAANEDLPF